MQMLRSSKFCAGETQRQRFPGFIVKGGELDRKWGVKMEAVAMTDKQWKDNLRVQEEDWEEVKELLPDIKENEKALKKIERVLQRIKKGLED